MGLWWALASSLIVSSSVATAATVVTTDPANRVITRNMQVLPLHVGGRVQATALPAPLPAGSKAYAHEWPGIYFEAAFTGDRFALKFDDGANEYRLIVDEGPPIALVRPGNVEVTVRGLRQGTHRLWLGKVTESVNHRGTFAGFYVPRGATLLPVRGRTKQIEFIGPSGMTGYGVRSTGPKCTGEAWRALSDTQRAYPALVARHYDADYQIDAASGHGLIRNLGGPQAGPGLVALYPFTFLDGTIPYADPAWQPQIIEISAFVDFMAGDPVPGEKWTSGEALLTDWTTAFGSLVAEIHRRSPDATLLIDWPNDADINPPQYRAKLAAVKAAITAAARQAGVRTILFPNPDDLAGKLELTGCDHHGSLKDQQKFADWLIAYIDAHHGIW